MSSLAEIRELVRETVGKVSGYDPASIGDSAQLGRDVNVDSLDLTEIAPILESRCGVRLADDDYINFTSVDTIASRIAQLTAAGEAVATSASE